MLAKYLLFVWEMGVFLITTTIKKLTYSVLYNYR